MHYIDNKKFFDELVEYRKQVDAEKELDNPPPPVSEYIASCFMKIAERLSTKPNFSAYLFREDMISDGVENCIRYAHNFDPSKSSNPFAYFTQIIYYAFVRKIQSEKKQLYFKYKKIEQASAFPDEVLGENPEETILIRIGHNQNNKLSMYDYIDSFEKKTDKKGSDKLISGSNLDLFMV